MALWNVEQANADRLVKRLIGDAIRDVDPPMSKSDYIHLVAALHDYADQLHDEHVEEQHNSNDQERPEWIAGDLIQGA